MKEKDKSAERSIFSKKVKKLKAMKGSGTELISVLIPFGTDRSSLTSQLTEEMSQSSNIKDPKTRKNVQAALKKIINFLKRIDFNLPKTGLAVFCGNISEQEGKTDIKLFTVRPVQNLETKLYWCDSTFFLEPLEAMVKPSEVYGIIVIDKNEATLALLMGTRYETIGQFKSRVPGKIRAGGQSAHRFERLREEAEHDFYASVSEKANQAFLKHLDKLKGIIVAGPGITKDYFLEAGLLDSRLAKKILGRISTSYTDESGVREAINRSGDLLKNTEIIREKEIIEEFLKNIIKTGLAVYGEKEVLEALETGKVKTLILSDELEKKAVEFSCPGCGKRKTRVFSEGEEQELKCSGCGTEMEAEEEKEYIDYLMEKAEKIGAGTIIVGTETEEGKEFLKGFGGIGAILRFK